MTEPSAADPATPTPTAAAAPAVPPAGPSAVGRSFGVLVALAVGIALRVGYAFELRNVVTGWESDAFLRAWVGRPWDALNRLRPPGAAWLHHRVGELLGDEPGLLVLRLIAIGVSIVAWLACFELAATMSRSSRIARRSLLAALLFVTWAWALHPTLIASSVRPDNVMPLGATLCLCLSGALKIHQRRFLIGWLQFTAGLTGALLTGGVIVAIAGVVGLLWSLLPVPPFASAGRMIAGFAVAFGIAWWAQAGPVVEPPRPWLPDTAGMHGAMALVEAPFMTFDPAEIDFEARELSRFDMLAVTVRNTPSVEILRAWIDRWIGDLHGPARFEGLPASLPRPWSPLVVALLEGLLRGGVLLFVVATMTATPLAAESAWPRAGAIVAVLLLGLLTTVTITGPFDLGALDLVFVGVAGAGMAGIDPSRPGARRAFFLVGGALACIFPALAWHSEATPSAWVQHGHLPPGRAAALALEYEWVRESDDIAAIQGTLPWLMHYEHPFARQPEEALELAWRQHDMAPDDPHAVNLLIRALLENGRIDEARDVANDSLLMTDSRDGQARMMIDLVDHVAKLQRARGDG